jgi:UDP-glucose:(heptosyl)LPS alpha-1,3-glucosyltransferase
MPMSDRQEALTARDRVVRLALVRQRFALDGGAERFVARLLEALAGEGLSLTLVTREWAEATGFEVLRLDPFHLGRLWRDWSFARAVCRRLAQAEYDLVQSHERIACCDVYRAGDGVHREWLAQLARTRGPLGRLRLALDPYHLYVRHAEKTLFTSPRLKAVICNSKMVKAEIKRHFGLAEEKLHVIYSGIDTERFHPRLRRERHSQRARYGLTPPATLFLFVGSGFERKGLAALLDALALTPADCHLWIVGRDRRQAEYEARAHARGLGARVRFFGAQPDVRPYYAAADALVLPSLYDPFPNVALEAMACGLPVVTSTKSGAAELIENGVNGFVCDALDVRTLAEALTALRCEDERERMGERARARVAPLTLAAMRVELLALYRKLLATGRNERCGSGSRAEN